MKSQTGKVNMPFVLVALIAIAIGLYVQTGDRHDLAQPEFAKTILLPKPKGLGEVDFIDHNGDAFDLSNLQGRWSILFFGFTNCPDICPTTMQTLKQVKQRVDEAGLWGNYQVVMVSVDPERDSTERLKNYVPFFDPEFVGISAELDYTTRFAKNVGILFFKGKPSANDSYDVDHGASLILVNPQGLYAGVLTGPHKVDEIAEDLIKLAKFKGFTAETATATPVRSSNTSELISGTTQQDLSFSHAWIRPAPPTATSMAAYFDVTNNTDQDIVINNSNSAAFNMTMIHETVVENEIASMRHLESLTIPAGSTVSLKPMATHMMLMGPKQPLVRGDRAELILIAEDGTQYSHTVTVMDPAR